jgi:hypothetical protein
MRDDACHAKALLGLGADLVEDRIGHLGVGLVLELDDRPPVVGDVAGTTDERDDRSHPRPGHRSLERGDIDRTIGERRRSAADRGKEGDDVALGDRLAPRDVGSIARRPDIGALRLDRGESRLQGRPGVVDGRRGPELQVALVHRQLAQRGEGARRDPHRPTPARG